MSNLDERLRLYAEFLGDATVPVSIDEVVDPHVQVVGTSSGVRGDRKRDPASDVGIEPDGYRGYRRRSVRRRRGRRVAVAIFVAAVVAVAIAVPLALKGGRSSTPTAPPAIPAGLFNSNALLTCSSASWCVVQADDTRRGALPFWSWDGRRWSLMRNGPSYADDSVGIVNGLASASDRQCVAVGKYPLDCANGSTCRDAPLMVEWDGTSWSQSSVGPGPGRTSAELDGVSCPALNDCLAVGATAAGALIERWDGARWSVMPNPLAQLLPPEQTGGQLSGEALQSVSCPTTTFCMAVGRFGDLYQASFVAAIAHHLFSGFLSPNFDRTAVAVVEEWNGAHWTASLVPYPHQPPAFDSSRGFDQVGCASVTMCAAIGSYYPGNLQDGDSAIGTAFDQWNGRDWAAAAWPPSASFSRQELAAMLGPDNLVLSCPPRSCFAAYLPSPPATGRDAVVAVARWDGARWMVGPSVAVPTFFALHGPPADGAFNYGFACGSAYSCLGIGSIANRDEGGCGDGEAYVASLSGGSWAVDIVSRAVPPPGCT